MSNQVPTSSNPVPRNNERLSNSIANHHSYVRQRDHLYGRGRRKYVTEPLFPNYVR